MILVDLTIDSKPLAPYHAPKAPHCIAPMHDFTLIALKKA
jgi:hypothetical protein